MAKLKAFYVSYELVHPTEADEDPYIESGWAGPRGWRYDGDPASAEAWTLRELKAEFYANPWALDRTRGIYSDTYENPYSGVRETLYLAKPDDVTDVSWARIVRVLKGQRAL